MVVAIGVATSVGFLVSSGSGFGDRLSIDVAGCESFRQRLVGGTASGLSSDLF